MFSPKVLGAIQSICAIVAGYFGWQTKSWGLLILALALIITAIHHLTEE